MHDEVSLDGSLRDEGAHDAAEGLPDGEDAGRVYLLLGNPCRLFNQLAEYLHVRQMYAAHVQISSCSIHLHVGAPSMQKHSMLKLLVDGEK